MMKDITRLSVCELSERLSCREVSAREATQAYLAQMETENGTLGAYITCCSEEALRQADAADALRRAGGAVSPLCGVPMAVKDNICTEGIRTTCASRMLADFVPPYSATAYDRLRSAGCVLLGKTNMDEFGMGSATENSAFFLTRNPHDLARTPGGSSGGSAAAVASGMAAFALGSDTGGSIRQPASHCGLVGMKPAYGRVSRYGLVAFASSLEQIGPLTRTVADNALVMQAIAGQDCHDATTLADAPPDMAARIEKPVRGLRVGLPREMLVRGIAPDVKARVLAAAKLLEEHGARVEETSIPSLSGALAAYYTISSAEASSNLGRYDGVRYGYRPDGCRSAEDVYLRARSEGFGTEVKRRIMLGVFVLSAGYYDAYYGVAQQVRRQLQGEFREAMERYDILLAPVAPTAAPLLGSTAAPEQAYLSDIYTVAANLTGLPALSVPFGYDGQGLPIGVQLIGGMDSEPLLYGVGSVLEKAGEQ